MRHALLVWIVAQSAPMIAPQYPHGYCTLPAEQLKAAEELSAEGFITHYPQNTNAAGGFPVTATDKGVEASKQPNPDEIKTPLPQPVPAEPAKPGASVVVESGIPMPDTKPRGFAAGEGGNAVDRFGFANMQIGQSFHLPPSNDPDKAKATHRTFSSTVSQANTKLHPKYFRVVEAGPADPRGPGARVFRMDDREGERPTRTRKVAPAAPQGPQTGQGAQAPAGFDPNSFGTMPQGGPGGFTPAPQPAQGGGFAAPGGFGAPAGFGAPLASPISFGMPTEGGPPAGFGAGPSFGPT